MRSSSHFTSRFIAPSCVAISWFPWIRSHWGRLRWAITMGSWLRPFRQMNLVPCASVNGTANVSEYHFCQVPPANSRRSSLAMAAWAEKLPRLPSVAAPAPASAALRRKLRRLIVSSKWIVTAVSSLGVLVRT